MDLNLFGNKKTEDNFINKFIEELKSVLENKRGKNQNEEEKSNVVDEYDRYERKKLFLDNKSRKSNELAWVMDENSVCLSSNGDGGPISITEVDLPPNYNVGDVFENVDGVFVFNSSLTSELSGIL